MFLNKSTVVIINLRRFKNRLSLILESCLAEDVPNYIAMCNRISLSSSSRKSLCEKQPYTKFSLLPENFGLSKKLNWFNGKQQIHCVGIPHKKNKKSLNKYNSSLFPLDQLVNTQQILICLFFHYQQTICDYYTGYLNDLQTKDSVASSFVELSTKRKKFVQDDYLHTLLFQLKKVSMKE